MVLSSDIIQTSVINIHPSPSSLSSRNWFTIIILTIIMLDFLGTTWTRLAHWLLEIGQIIFASKSFTTYFWITSFRWGFNLCYISLAGLLLSSKWILCMQIVWLIPFNSTTNHPIVPLWSDKRWINSFSWSEVKKEEMMIGRVFLGPKTHTWVNQEEVSTPVDVGRQ